MREVKKERNDYVTRVLESPAEVDAAAWNALLAQQSQPTPFMRHEYLAAMHDSRSAVPKTGWTARFVTLSRDGTLAAGCVVYLKDHSYGEYVFDWAWANAYEQNGLAYYPKALVAAPFTPVPGTRLLAEDEAARAALIHALGAWCEGEALSSLHLLFLAEDDIAACEAAGLMLRHTVQFHWTNGAPTLGTDMSSLPSGGAHFALGRPGGEIRRYVDFDDFLASLSQEKRKKIRQERRKVADAGVTFRTQRGTEITAKDWDFFYRCYERTYYEHGNAPYLTRDFFARMAAAMPEAWLLFTAEREGRPVAISLIALEDHFSWATSAFDSKKCKNIAYGRYWGAIERVDALHFEACYYQPIEWCIANGFDRFEGGAQGEHKMARALMPVKTTSAHWLAHPAFADAVEKFLAREGAGIEGYLERLDERSPFRPSNNDPTTGLK